MGCREESATSVWATKWIRHSVSDQARRHVYGTTGTSKFDVTVIARLTVRSGVEVETYQVRRSVFDKMLLGHGH